MMEIIYFILKIIGVYLVFYLGGLCGANNPQYFVDSAHKLEIIAGKAVMAAKETLKK